jgi:hypothetical protein
MQTSKTPQFMLAFIAFFAMTVSLISTIVKAFFATFKEIFLLFFAARRDESPHT